MTRNVFEEMDARAAAAVGRLLEEPATWFPMQTRPGGGEWTTDRAPTPDLDRPVMTDLSAIVTWASTVKDGAPGAGGQQMATGQLIVDMDVAQFEGRPLPRKGDRLGLPQQKPGERQAEIIRRSDDGSARVLYTCQIVKG